jgi:hypothetical protein
MMEKCWGGGGEDDDDDDDDRGCLWLVVVGFDIVVVVGQ